MLNKADIFLARRYLRPRRSLTSVILLLSILGPALGVAVLIVTTSVFTGFQREIQHRLIDMQAHLRVVPAQAAAKGLSEQAIISDPQSIMQVMREAGVTPAPSLDDLALLQSRGRMEIKSLQGIDPELEEKITDLERGTILGTHRISHGEVLIGQPLAENLGLNIGDQLLLHSPRRLTEHIEWREDGTVKAEEIDTVRLPEEVEVAGIFTFGIHQLDSNVIYIHIDQAAELLGLDWDTADSIKGGVEDPFDLRDEAAALQARLPDYHVITWQEENKRLLGAVQVEKNLTLFLLFFIVLVAAFSIAGTLITSVIQKTREIGILKAIGLSPFTIARVFLYQGMLIGAAGTAIGCLGGVLIVYYRESVADFIARLLGREIFPPELYYLDRIPAWISAGDVMLITFLALAACVLAALLPALYASALKPARALAEE